MDHTTQNIVAKKGKPDTILLRRENLKENHGPTLVSADAISTKEVTIHSPESPKEQGKEQNSNVEKILNGSGVKHDDPKGPDSPRSSQKKGSNIVQKPEYVQPELVDNLKSKEVRYEEERKIKESALQKQIQDLRQKLVKTTEEKNEFAKLMAKEKARKEQALTRLSEVAGTKLTDNNAAITDLSDVHRPQKLGEMFAEIYDNEWTDAYEELQNQMSATLRESEEDNKIAKIAEDLLTVLRNCYKHCTDQASRLLLGVSDVVRNVGLSKKDENADDFLPGSSSKKIKDFGKSVGVDLLPRIRELYFNDQKNKTQSTAVSKYTAKCLQFCWYAALQDPPVYFESQADGKELQFDPNKYREFTKKGRLVDFVVWPELYLHEGGALLAKGVVQCKEDSQSNAASKVKNRDDGESNGTAHADPARANDEYQASVSKIPTATAHAKTFTSDHQKVKNRDDGESKGTAHADPARANDEHQASVSKIPTATAHAKTFTSDHQQANLESKLNFHATSSKVLSQTTPFDASAPQIQQTSTIVNTKTVSAQGATPNCNLPVKDWAGNRTENPQLPSDRNIPPRNDSSESEKASKNTEDRQYGKLQNSTDNSNINEIIKKKEFDSMGSKEDIENARANLKNVKTMTNENKEPGYIYISKVDVKNVGK